jgi:hypothetical protein
VRASTVLLSVLLVFRGGESLSAAPVPPPPPVPVKPPPSSWKTADFNALLPDPDDAGPVAVLVWEVIDYEGFCPVLERCLVVKKYAKPKDGAAYALGYFQRHPGENQPTWKPSSVVQLRDNEIETVVGVKGYKNLPSDGEIATFLKDRIWDSEVKHIVGSRNEVGKPKVQYAVTPKVTDGGICRAEWKKVFDREPPAKLFPELTAPAEKK